MSELSHSDIEHLARLARLAVTSEEADRYAGQLTKVVAYVEQLQAVDVSGVDHRLGVTGMKNVLRADAPELVAGFDRDAALAAAPLRDNDVIEVRAVLGGEVEAA